MPVTCYICGRDFGTRSIGIHLPNCQKKWDQEQDKLPKSQRRDLPKPPEDFDKVLSGEIKGKALQKMNNKAFEDYNDTALMPCEHCGRTFLPKSLTSHQKLCTEHSPMTKPAKSKSYSGKAKARVKYPALKPRASAKKPEPKRDPEKIDLPPIESRENSSSSRDTSPTQTLQEEGSDAPTDEDSDDVVHEATAEQINIAIVQQMDEQDDTEDSSDKSNRSSMVESESSLSGAELSDTVATPSDSSPPSDPLPAPSDNPTESLNIISQPVENHFQPSKKATKTGKKVASKPKKDDNNAQKKTTANVTPNVLPTPNRPPSGRGPGTFKKRGTFTYKNQVCDKSALVALVQDSELLQDPDHATKVYGLIQEYFREVRTTQLRGLFSGSVFEEEENCVEALEILQEFVKLKTNNNQ